jgi:hypothetical protein
MNIFWKIFNDENYINKLQPNETIHNEQTNNMSEDETNENYPSETILFKLSQIKTNIKNDLSIVSKYKKYFTISNVLHKNICDYIVTESEKYATVHSWTNNRHAHYPTTDIPVKRIKNIHVLVDNIVKYDILPLFEKYYNISKYFLEYNDLFIVKYDENAQNKLEKHRDGSLFSFNVLLNSPSEFVGGGTIFEINGEDILVNNTQGGVVIHSGKLLHSGNEITEGKRYLLVGFIKYLGDF